jgi:hypothetical protein
MPDPDKAESVIERVNAEMDELTDPSFDEAFARGVSVPDGEDIPKEKEVPVPAPAAAEPAKPAAEAPAAEPEKPTPAAQEPKKPDAPDAPPATPEPEKPPLTAIEKAEAEGAKLVGAKPSEPPAAATPKADEPKSVIEMLPEGYEDAGKIVESDSFRAWFEKAPKHIQKLGIDGGVDGACAVLDFFRSHTAKTAASAAQAATPSAAKKLMAEIGDVEMVQSDGSKIKVSEYLEEYGDMGEAIAVIADALAGKRVGSVQKPDQDAAGDRRIAQLESELAELRYWGAITVEHSDARKIVRTDGFREWAKNASEGVKRLLGSANPDHAVLALDAYKEHCVQQAKASSAPTGGKAKTIAVHSDTARSAGGAKATPKTGNPDDFDAGFEEGLNSK